MCPGKILINNESCNIDCSPPRGVIQFASATHKVLEADDAVTVEITRIDGSAGAIEALVSTTDGTAVIGEDYNGIPSPLTLTWPDGNTVPRTITFPILPDANIEPNETFTVNLSLPAGVSGLLGSAINTEIIITDVPPP